MVTVDMVWLSKFFGGSTRKNNDISTSGLKRACSSCDTRPSKKSRSSEDDSFKDKDTSSLSNDILHHILGFLVSNSGLVDGRSIRAATLVCKQWKNVATSRSLWAIPAGIANIPIDQVVVEQINSSLQIRETASVDTFLLESERRHELSKESLIGFRKMSQLDSTATATDFRAMERATGTQCILSVAKNEGKTSELIKEIFEAHFVQADDFLKQPNNRADEAARQTSIHRCFLRGVCVLNGRVVRWYEDLVAKDQHAHEQNTPRILTPLLKQFRRVANEPQPHISKPKSNLLELRRPVDQLLHLEHTLGTVDRSRPHVRMECWAIIVDWIIEIVECFDLEDATAFQTMALFDRFLASSSVRPVVSIACACWIIAMVYTDIPMKFFSLQQPVKMSQYQLVAGACLLIASKCNDVSIKGSDISYCADNSFNGAQVTATEEFVLEHLEWKLAFPTPLDFVNAYARTLGLDMDGSAFSMMIRYVVELALQSPIYLAYKSSIIAASAIVLARLCLPNDNLLWPQELQRETNYSLQDLRDCTMELSRMLDDVRSTMPELIMITRRYRKHPRWNVANVSIPSISSFAVLAAYQERQSRRDDSRI
jgi:hypothetical protein